MTRKRIRPLRILAVLAVFLAAVLYMPEGVLGDFVIRAKAETTITPSKPNGNGTAETPYEISNAAELYWFAGLVNGTLTDGTERNSAANAVLTANITVNSGVLNSDGTLNTEAEGSFTAWTPIGNSSYKYTGIFDGNGKTVSGLYFNDSRIEYVGLFGCNTGTIKKVGVVNSYFNAQSKVSGVCGENGGTIENCYNSGTVSMNWGYAGGVCAYNKGGTIEKCYNTGTVIGEVNSSMFAPGGVCGYNDYQQDIKKGIITNCYNTGTVSSNESAGGVCGYNIGTITNCYNTGTVSGEKYVGSVCGINDNSTYIVNCYYLDTSAKEGIGNKYGTSDKVESKTIDRFYSGEVAYLLAQGYTIKYTSTSITYSGDVWGQDLSATTDYPDLSGVTVYPCTSGCTAKYSNTVGDRGVHTAPDRYGDNGFGGCKYCGAELYQPAILNGSAYEISNAGQLYWFAALVNGTLTEDTPQNVSANAVLKNNIVVNQNVLENGALNEENKESLKAWTPIGDVSKKYTGTFDGAGNTVSGLYFNTERKSYVGLFGYNKGTIQNVGVIDSYFSSHHHVAGVCGCNEGTITNCYNTGAVSGIDRYDSGMVAASSCRIGGVCGENNGTIKNCYNTGDVSGNEEVGGLCGVNGYSDYTIENCYSTGAVSGKVRFGGLCGANDSTIKNCYYLGTAETDSISGTTFKTKEQFASGEVAYLLNGSTSEGTLVWGQNKEKDLTPVLGGMTVYQTTPCLSYTNDNSNLSKNHTYINSDGFCSVCGYYDPATKNGDVYEISNAGQLYWFAALVNGTLTDGTLQDVSANAVLKNDIVINQNVLVNGALNEESKGSFKVWMPIGNSGVPYRGTFNGNDCTIGGLYYDNDNTSYVGLFGNNEGTIQNVGVIDSYFKGRAFIGGVCGENSGIGENSGTIKNCYNTSAVGGTSSVGGVCGENSSTIKNCYNTGDVSGTNNIGGVCGQVGYTYSKGSIENCYNTGTVNGTGDNVGSVCGYKREGVTVINCYYLAASELNGIGTDEGTTEKVESKTAGLFASGEVAYLLQGLQTEAIWGQTLTGETPDAYPVLGGAVVYPTSGCTGYSNTENETKPHQDDKEDGICDVCGIYMDGIGAKLAGYTLSLNGNIGVNFYMELSKEIAGSTTAYMQFTLPGGEVTKVMVAEVKDSARTVNGKTCYIFPCEVSSYEMTQPIKAQMFDGNGNSGTEYSYTVRDYGEYIINHSGSYTGNDVAFAKALLNYGAYAQTYFDVAVDDLANKSLVDAEKDVTSVTADSLEDYKAVSVSNDLGTFAGYSLTLKSETTLKAYFKPADGVDVSTLTFTAAGQTVTPVKSGEYYVLALENIKAWNLDTSYEFTVSNSSDTLNFSCSAMSYAYSVLLHSEDYDSKLVQLIQALRIYQQSAEVYGSK